MAYFAPYAPVCHLNQAAQALLYAADDPSDVTAELRSTWRRRALGLLRPSTRSVFGEKVDKLTGATRRK